MDNDKELADFIADRLIDAYAFHSEVTTSEAAKLIEAAIKEFKRDEQSTDDDAQSETDE